MNEEKDIEKELEEKLTSYRIEAILMNGNGEKTRGLCMCKDIQSGIESFLNLYRGFIILEITIKNRWAELKDIIEDTWTKD